MNEVPGMRTLYADCTDIQPKTLNSYDEAVKSSGLILTPQTVHLLEEVALQGFRYGFVVAQQLEEDVKRASKEQP